MSDTVSLPVETARAIAAWLRGEGAPHTAPDAQWADLLDPRPSLRDAVARAICASDDGEFVSAEADDYRRNADVALAVVHEHIAALRVNADEYANRGWADGYTQAIDDACNALGAES